MNKKRTISITILVLLLGTLFTIAMLYTTTNYRLALGTPTSLNTDWYYRVDDTETIPIEELPSRITLEERTPYTIETILPTSFSDPQHILIRTSLANITVTLDGNILYEANFENEKTYASTWHIIDIPQNSDGQTLSLTFDTPYASMRGIINEITYGDLTSLYTQIFRDFGLRLSLGLITLFIGIVFVLTSLILRKDNQYTIYIGVFAIIFSFWLISESRMLQFMIGNPNILGSLSYISIALFPLPLAIYIRNVLIVDHKHFFSFVCVFFAINTVLVTTLHFTGIASFFETVTISIIMLLISVIIMLVLLIIEYKKYRSKLVLKVFIIFLIVAFFTFLEVVIFSLSDFRRTSDFAATGLGLILIIIFINFIQFSLKNYKGSLERTLYERLAYTDQLTGAFNRFAYFKDIDHLNQIKDHPVLRLVYFDLDNLKTINDNFGHPIGDEAIQNAYKLINTAFGNQGKCYRMGGDEFVCIIEETDVISFQKNLDQFNQHCEAFDAETEYTFSISTGSAVYNVKQDQSYDDTLTRSDKMMYKQKQSKR